MKPGIHPETKKTTIVCACGNRIETISTKDEIHVEICSVCHPFYTGKQRLMDAAGRVERFKRRAEWKLAVNMEAKDGSPPEAMLDGDPQTGYFTKGSKPFPVESLSVELPARSRITGIDVDSSGEKQNDSSNEWLPVPTDRQQVHSV